MKGQGMEIIAGGLTVLFMVGFLFFLLFIGPILGFVGGWWNSLWQHASPAHVLKTYEWFKEQHTAMGQLRADIEMADIQIQSFEESAGARSQWDWHDKEEHSRLVTVRMGYIQRYNQLAAQYNAEASKITTKWFEGGIPQEIAKYEEGT